MDGHALKMARKKANLSQEQAAKDIGADVRSWRRWESGDRAVPDHVATFIEQAAAEPRPASQHDPRTVTGEPMPDDEPGRVAFALRVQATYLAFFESIPSKLGRDTPYAWAVDYWNSGVLRWPMIQFGPGGTIPCATAYQAAMRRAATAAGTGLLQRVFAQLDDCPGQIKAAAAPLPVNEPEII